MKRFVYLGYPDTLTGVIPGDVVLFEKEHPKNRDLLFCRVRDGRSWWFVGRELSEIKEYEEM